ncbi:kinase-like domain-containing protein [Rhodocollybia butyracea]|uniref:non-specific serine/threonine protein kinase n=1 Tax=Rhodocollybia butyracea TaxID=206335 RepID=A0A9P5PZF5_9AGAR|nr:kinase-like domain-containing protein [Rhodocollybia butyracea]
MLSPSQEDTITSLAALSRNASVISSSSSSDSIAADDSRLLATPVHPRLLRTFSSPRSASPASPTRKTSRAPSFLPKELGLADDYPKSRAASQVRSKSRARSEVSIDDFDVGDTLGEGSYSTVLQATARKTGKQYAIKVLDKTHLARKNKTFTAKIERLALIRLGRQHPGIVSLYWTFQDAHSLYFVLDLAANGEMQTLISRLGSLSTRCARYYTAQIVDIVEYMHSKGVIHRDLKPENLLLDASYRLKIADFGTAKVLNADVETERFVGTAQYVAPELVVANESSESSDLWALGCVLFQMISGRFAFSGLSEYLTLQKVKQAEYVFPGEFDEDAKDLVQKLLIRDPKQRLGAGEPMSPLDMRSLRSHPFFDSIDWTTLWTDPAPPLEAGILQREHSLARGQDRNWEDIGATWDELVMNDDNVGASPDGLGWAPDAEGSPLLLRHRQFDPTQSQTQPVDLSPVSNDLTEQGPPPSATEIGSMPINISSFTRPTPESPSGSPESSSEGAGSLERVAIGLQAMRPFRLPSDHSVDHERGRSQAPTPIQGNTFPATELPSILNPRAHEVILQRSTVEVRSIRRRASRLLKPIAGAQIKTKTRELILTNHRLICFKIKSSSRNSPIKSELFFKSADEWKEKDKKKDVKEMKAVLMSAELKEGREFVVLSSIKTFHYAAQDALTASLFVDKINEAKNS